MSNFTTPTKTKTKTETKTEKKIKINEDFNVERIDSGNYPKKERQENSYNQTDLKNFREDQTGEALFNRAQNAIYTNGEKIIPPPSGPEIMSNLKNLEQYRRWGGSSKKMRSHKNKLTKRTRRNKHSKTTKTKKPAKKK